MDLWRRQLDVWGHSTTTGSKGSRGESRKFASLARASRPSETDQTSREELVYQAYKALPAELQRMLLLKRQTAEAQGGGGGPWENSLLRAMRVQQKVVDSAHSRRHRLARLLEGEMCRHEKQAPRAKVKFFPTGISLRSPFS